MVIASHTFRVRDRLRLRPNWYLLVVVVSWGLNFVAVKEAYKQIDPPALALLRFLLMWGALALICVTQKVSLRIPREDLVRFLYFGFFSMGVYMVAFLEGMRGSAATEGAILFQLSPVFTAILSAAFGHEKFSPRTIFGAIVALLGTALIVYSPSAGAENKLLSNLIVILAAFLWAYCVTLTRSLLTRYSPLQVFTYSMVGGLPVMLAYGLLPAWRQHWSSVNLYGWSMFFHVSIISGVVAFICFYRGVKEIGGTGATMYQFFVPAAAMFFSIAIQRTLPTFYQLAGFVVVLFGVWYASRARQLMQSASLGGSEEHRTEVGPVNSNST